MPDFPIVVVPVGSREVAMIGPGFRVVMCAHGARALAEALKQVQELQHCKGSRHDDDSSMFTSVEHNAIPRENETIKTVKANRWTSR